MYQRKKTPIHWFFCLCLTACGSLLSAQTYTIETVPDPKSQPSSRFVSDPAGIFPPQITTEIDRFLMELEDSSTAQVAVVVLPSISDEVPKDFAHALFQKWGVGYQDKNNGLLILLVIDQRRVEFETGYGLEGLLPDAECARIQREAMIPYFKKNDYATGTLEGVKEITAILQHPENLQEIRASRQGKNEPLGMEEYLFFAFFSGIFLFLWSLFRWGIRSINPIKKQVDRQKAKEKSPFWVGISLFFLVPVGIAVALGLLTEYIQVSFWELLLGWYAYVAFVFWDSRSRREKVFRSLFATASKAELYTYQKAFSDGLWIDAVLFPAPFALLWRENNQQLHDLRYHPRNSAAGHPLHILTPKEAEQYLSPYQKVENSINTVAYDVWRNEQYDITEIFAYPNLCDLEYTRCTVCQSMAVRVDKKEVTVMATMANTGILRKQMNCKACGDRTHKDETIPRLKAGQRLSSNGTIYSSSGSGSGSSSGGSSWGGGRSGGGGAGSSW
jgi:uncharacterized protein